MPVRFRCNNCQQLMSISTKKIGNSINCPVCKTTLFVPDTDIVSGQVFQKDSSRSPGADETVGIQEEAPRESLFDRLMEEDEDQTVMASATTSSHYSEVEEAEEAEEGVKEHFQREEAPTQTPNQPEPSADYEEVELKRNDGPYGDLDLTSMVDVTFLLLIFFMITASFSVQKTIDFPPPNPEAKGAVASTQLEEIQNESVNLKIDEKGTISIDDEAIPDFSVLEDRLTNAKLITQRTDLLIDAHPNSEHGIVVAVIDAANQVGMQNIRMVSRNLDQ